jgi:hypothetical protein
MKLNFGNYITIAFIAFGAFIVTLVVKTFAFKPELVSETYYEDEINYQERINMLKNVQADGANIKWELKGDSLILQFPNEKASGKIDFMCHADKDKDLHFDIQILNKNQQIINTSGMKSGLYLMKIQWTSNSKLYYMEQNISI